jgi:hypothetical protein
MNTSIFAGNRSFDIGCKVVKWDEPNGFDFTPFNSYVNQAHLSDDELKNEIKQFCIHWSVTWNASSMFNGLKSRGLSANFMIDDDINDDGHATVYQCLDVKYGGYTQGGKFNSIGRGVEIAYQPQYWQDPTLYSESNMSKYNTQPHDTTMALVHGTKLKVYLPSDAQMNSLLKLTFGFINLFPDIPPSFPKLENGEFCYTVLPDAESFSGLVNHYNLTRNKIDTAGIDLALIEKYILDKVS